MVYTQVGTNVCKESLNLNKPLSIFKQFSALSTTGTIFSPHNMEWVGFHVKLTNGLLKSAKGGSIFPI